MSMYLIRMESVMLSMSFNHTCTKMYCFLSVAELTFAWIFNEYPYFVQQDNRRFISQETGSLYIAKVESSDVGNYTCVVNNTVTREKVLSSPTPLVLRSDGKCLKSLFVPSHCHSSLLIVLAKKHVL